MFHVNQLTGFGSSVAIPIKTLAIQGTPNKGNGGTITIPAVTAGDLIVIYASTSVGTLVEFPGFTHAVAYNSGTIQTISYKISDGTETTITNHSGSLFRYWCAAVFRGDKAISSVEVGSPQSVSTSNDPGALTISMSGVIPVVIGLGTMMSSAAITGQTISPTMTEITGTVSSVLHHYLIYNDGSSPQNVTYDQADNGNGNTVTVCYLILK